MSDRWPGGIISGTPPVPTGGGAGDSASGIWTIEQADQYIATNEWPGTGIPDPQFQYVTALLHGDGTNAGQNNTFIDSSPNNFTITRNGNTTQGSFSPYGDLWSNFFSGVGTSIRNTSTFLVGSTTSTFTAECWVNLTANTASGGSGDAPTLICLNGLQAGATYLTFGLDSSNRVVLYWFDTNGRRCTGTTSLQIGVWYHIAASVSSNTIRLFVNGVSETLSGTTTLTNRGANSNGFYVGSSTSGDPFFAINFAYVSNVRVNNTTALYSSNFTPSTTPLTAVSGTALLTCQSNRFIDNSSNAYAWTTVGTPSVQRFSPFQNLATYTTARVGGSGYFDGSGDYLNTATNSAFSFGTGDFTIELWLYPTSFSGTYQTYVSTRTGSGTGADIQLFNGTELMLGNDSGSIVSANNVLRLNAWNYIAASRSGSTNRLYVNGTLVGTATNSTNFTSNGCFISSGQGGNNNPAIGYITDVRIVKGTALYTGSTISVPTAPLTNVTNTSLLANFTNAAIFDSDASNDFETVGNAQISTSVFKYGTGSMFFDGNGDGLYRPATPNLDFGTGNFTIEWWMYFNSQSGFQTIMSYGYTPETSTGWLIQTGNGNGKIIFYKQSGGVTVASDTGPTVNNGEWYHMAVVRVSGVTTIYRNGISVGSGSDTNNYVAPTANFYLGGGSSASFNNFYFNGYIDDLRITKGYARYWYNFQPPTRAFPNYGGTIIEMEDPLFEYNTLLLNGDGTNGGQNNTFLDSSTNNFTITRNGNTTQGSFSPYGTLWSNYFNGSSYLRTPSNSTFNFSSTDCTIEFWFSGSTSGGLVVEWGTGASGDMQIELFNGGMTFGPSGGAAKTFFPVAANAWNHIAAVKTGTTYYLYINGTRNTTSSGTAASSAQIVSIGARNGGSVYTTGYISNLRISSTALYTGTTLTVPTAPYTAETNTRLLTCQSNRFIDNSTNAFAISVFGTPSVQRFSPFEPSAPYSTSVIGGSCTVDGTGDYLQFTNTLDVSGTFTIEGWFYPTTLSFPAFDSGVIIASNKNSGSGVNGIGLALYNTGELYFFLGNGAAIVANPTIAINQWHHFAYVYDGTTVSAYLNGTRVGTSAQTIVNNSQITTIGQSVGGVNWDASVRYIGIIGQIRATNTQVYTGTTYTVPTSPLTAISGTNYLVNMSNAAIPDRAMQNNLETVGNAQISTSVVKYGSGSLSFDGSGDYLFMNNQIGFPTNAPFTIECWLYLNSSGNAGIFTKGGGAGSWSTTNGHQFLLFIESGNFYWMWNNAGSNTQITVTPPATGIWTHIAVTYDGTTTRLFFNGNIMGTSTTAYTLPTTRNRVVVGALPDFNYPLNGYIDDLRFTQGIARYVQPFTPPTAALPTY